MNQIPSKTRLLFEAHLKNKAIPETACFYCEKRLRYYLDFCSKYRYQQLNKENVKYLVAFDLLKMAD